MIIIVCAIIYKIIDSAKKDCLHFIKQNIKGKSHFELTLTTRLLKTCACVDHSAVSVRHWVTTSNRENVYSKLLPQFITKYLPVIHI